MSKFEIMFSLPGEPLTPEQIEYIRERIDMKPYYETLAEIARARGIELSTETEDQKDESDEEEREE